MSVVCRKVEVTHAPCTLLRQNLNSATLHPAAKDEWDFAFQGASNHPFIKANYPHHEGRWGWGNVGDQVVLMVPNIRRSMIECEHMSSVIACFLT